MIKNHSCSCFCNNRKYPLLVLLRSCCKTPIPVGVDSCTPDPAHLCRPLLQLHFIQHAKPLLLYNTSSAGTLFKQGAERGGSRKYTVKYVSFFPKISRHLHQPQGRSQLNTAEGRKQFQVGVKINIYHRF